MVKILDLSHALRLADHGHLPLPPAVLESKRLVNGIFVTLHADLTRGSASCSAGSAKALSVKEVRTSWRYEVTVLARESIQKSGVRRFLWS
jgi:hypothetical protein